MSINLSDETRERVLKWVEALESGDYNQTTEFLRIVDSGDPDYPEGYCCWGVACELFKEELKLEVEVQHDPEGRFVSSMVYGNSQSAPSPVVEEAVGLLGVEFSDLPEEVQDHFLETCNVPTDLLHSWTVTNLLMHLNDGSGGQDGQIGERPWSFKKIAALLRKIAGLPPAEETP